MQFRNFELKRDLSRAGWPTIRAWAEFYGYKPDTVRRVMPRRWNMGTKPRGRTAVRILKEIESALNKTDKK